MKLLIPIHIATREVEDEVVLLNLETEQYFGLDDVGAVFWRSLATDGVFESGLSAVLAEYEIDTDTARSDLEDLVAELASLGLVEREP